MSREQRRSTQGSARSRRTPAAPAGGGGFRIPLLPIAVVLGVAVVAGLMGYLIWQQTKPVGESGAVKVEADANPDLPGEFVNLPEIYGDDSGPASYGGSPPTAPHVTRDVDYEEDGQGLPPTGGPHWGSGRCSTDLDSSTAFCGPVPEGFYREPWDAESLIHNMEHTGIVVWFNTTDQEILDDLLEFAEDNNRRFLVVSSYPDMEEETVAITGWSRRLIMSVDDYDRDQLQDFLDVHECRFDPEGFC